MNYGGTSLELKGFKDGFTFTGKIMALKIKTRLQVGFFSVSLTFFMLAAFAFWQINVVSSASVKMEAQTQLLELAGKWQADVRQNSARSLAVAYSDGDSMLNFFKEAMAQTSKDTSKTQTDFLASTLSASQRERATNVGDARKLWLASRAEINELKAAGSGSEAKALIESKFMPLTKEYLAATQSLLTGQISDIHDTQLLIESVLSRLYLVGAILLFVCIVISVVTCQSLTHRIVSQLSLACKAAQKIGAGNLTSSLVPSSQDELGQLTQALADMQESLIVVVSNVRNSSDILALATAEVAQGGGELAARTESQASALEQTAAAVEELTITIRKNAENSLKASKIALDAATVTKTGSTVVDEIISTVAGISESSLRITDIVGVIDSIAFQTNILALNAAVEAARAGDQGLGFAVIASEVRALSQRSAIAAKEIKALVTVNVERAQMGQKQAAKAGDALTLSLSSIEDVSKLIGGISLASKEQSLGMSQVEEAVQQLNQVTQQNSALVEELSSAGESIKEQAQELVQSVAVFRIDPATQRIKKA